MHLIINPNHINDLKTIDEAVMIGLHPFSHSMNCIFEDANQLINFVNEYPKAYYLYLNHMIDQDKLDLLKMSLIQLNNIKLKLMFEDYSILQVVKTLNLNIDLVLAGKNSVTSASLINTSETDMALVSNDLALEDLNALLTNVTKPVIIHGFGYENIYYSKRPVISNYLNTFTIEPKTAYYLRLKDKANYPIIEEDGYSYIYSDKYFNIINLISKLNIKDNYLLLNSYLIDEPTFNNHLEQFRKVIISNESVELPSDSSNYVLANPNYYKVKDYA